MNQRNMGAKAKYVYHANRSFSHNWAPNVSGPHPVGAPKIDELPPVYVKELIVMYLTAG